MSDLNIQRAHQLGLTAHLGQPMVGTWDAAGVVVREIRNRLHEGFTSFQRKEGRRDGIETEKEKAQSQDTHPEVLPALRFREESGEKSDSYQEKSELSEIQRNEPARDGRSDVGTENDPDRLSEIHEARVHESHGHDRGHG